MSKWEQKLELIVLDSYDQFFGVSIQVGYDVIYWYEDSEGWIICDKVFEPLYLPQIFNILIQFGYLIDWSFLSRFFQNFFTYRKSITIIPPLPPIQEVSSSLEESLKNSPLLKNIEIIPDSIFNSLINLKNLTPIEQINLFKNLYATEAFQNLAKIKYGSFEGFLEMIDFFDKNNLVEEQNTAIFDMVTTIMEQYVNTKYK